MTYMSNHLEPWKRSFKEYRTINDSTRISETFFFKSFIYKLYLTGDKLFKVACWNITTSVLLNLLLTLNVFLLSRRKNDKSEGEV
jgi:hypothetical protein